MPWTDKDDGPEGLCASLRDALPAVRKLREEYDDARIFSSAQQLPMPLFDPVCIEALLDPPLRPVDIAKRVALWDHLRHPDVSRFGVSALDDINRQYVWLDDPNGPYSWPMPL